MMWNQEIGKGEYSSIYKNGDWNNYIGITLGSIVGKLYVRILENILREREDKTMEETQIHFGRMGKQMAIYSY